MRWYGDDVREKIRAAAADGLLEAAEALRQDSQAEVPTQEHILQLSAETDVDRRNLKAVVSYDTPYAVKQHEDRTLRHDNGKAKYLEDPANANAGRYMDHVAQRIKEASQ
jgi:hypothetical protein